MKLPQELLWFSNRCPYFSPLDAEKYFLITKSEKIKERLLTACGFFKAAMWILEQELIWKTEIENIKSEEGRLSKVGGGLIFWGDEDYPESLKNIYYPPAVLICLGNKKLLNEKTIGIVGSRKPTELGRLWVEQVVPQFVDHDFTIISGGARGIDYEAHIQTLLSEGKTVAFLPGGVMNPYPYAHRNLYKNILEKEGLLVSEFLSTDSVRKENFHQRNRLISACSGALIIVEAGIKSGTIMTAHKAIEQNRDLFVLPGSPLIKNYEGSLELISQGASIVRSAQDVLAGLDERKNLKKQPDSLTLL